ncbi:Uncharacterized protein HZ326_8074 [Fusarium oxysporum f. sp. albedinis]|nr:Uncharacterized protein HZ326_8074 [Fusarium oxysporum f. sp. albedinis]
MPIRLCRGDFQQRPPSSALGEGYPLSNDKLAAQLCACCYIVKDSKLRVATWPASLTLLELFPESSTTLFGVLTCQVQHIDAG